MHARGRVSAQMRRQAKGGEEEAHQPVQLDHIDALSHVVDGRVGSGSV